MKPIKKIFDGSRHHFENGGKFSALRPLFDATETFFFFPGILTKKDVHVRDSLDVKRYMSIVLVALTPPFLFGIYNAGYQANLAAGAPPNFAAVYNLMGCAQMFFDPELKLNMAMLVHGEQEFEFIGPVKPGDVITTTGKIVDIMEKGNNDLIVYEARSSNQDGELVTVGRATFVIRGG